MNSELRTSGLFGTVLLAAACASGGSPATSDMRSEARLDDAASRQLLPRRSCTASSSSVAPSNGLIADFSAQPGSGRGSTSGGIPAKVISSLSSDSAPDSTLTHAFNGGRLTVGVHAIPGAAPQFLVTTMLFDGCVDASGFSGVEFDLSGSLSGCSMTYASVDPAHQYYAARGPYPPQTRIAEAEVSPEPRTITAPFLHTEIQGNPATPIDPSHLAFLQWMVIVPVGSHDGSTVPPCTGTLHIDNVKLYR